jgi:hypothetical protein
MVDTSEIRTGLEVTTLVIAVDQHIQALSFRLSALLLYLVGIAHAKLMYANRFFLPIHTGFAGVHLLADRDAIAV